MGLLVVFAPASAQQINRDENDVVPELGTSLISAAVTNLNTKLWSLNINVENKEQIIQSFCMAANPQFATGFSSSIESYDSSQSLFLSILCNTNGLENKYFNQQTQKYLKELSYKKLKFDKACQRSYTEKCNVAELTDDLLTQLFSELFTFKQAEIFWISQDTLVDSNLLNKKIDAYAEEKYKIPHFCTDRIHNYSQTCSIMSRQMKAFVPVIKGFKILNSDELYKNVKDKGLTFPPCEIGPHYDLVLCGTLGETDKWLKPFINMLYNELARYTMFSTYYAQALMQRSRIELPTQDEISLLKENRGKFFFLTNQTLNDLTNLATTYPIHIGFLAYQEDLLRLRDSSLSKLVTPFYTLYHKLRNVQSET